jgi:hypothetical protein
MPGTSSSYTVWESSILNGILFVLLSSFHRFRGGRCGRKHEGNFRRAVGDRNCNLWFQLVHMT